MISMLLLAAAGIGACHDLHDRGLRAEAGQCYERQINTVEDPLVIGEAYWRLGNIDAANSWMRRAADAQPDNAEVRVAWGRLFLSVHQMADAQALLQEALVLDADNVEARLALAELYAATFEGRAEELLRELLRDEPENTRARLLRAQLSLQVGDVVEARTPLEALLLDADLPVGLRLETLALLAAADHMASDQMEGVVESPHTSAALALNPRFGRIYSVPAYYYVITRRYAEAVALYEQAVATDPELYEAHADLGVNLLRVNRLDDARKHLQLAYAGDAYNAVTVNTLRLLDSLEQFDTVVEEKLIMRAEADESAALAPFVAELVDEAQRTMAPRYNFEFSRPVVVELYQHHDDFAVRTAGLPGIGILGAAFGDVVVMDGPSAKSISEGFDWASALWHEIAHVVTLGATGNRVSRWFSEGVSVLEEWARGPSPRDSVSLTFLEAWMAERLLGVASLDEGFIRPSYPGQIMVSYVQAGLVCQFIDSRFEGGLGRMLGVYARGGTTQTAFVEGLGLEPVAFDVLFEKYLEDRFGPIGAELERFQELVAGAAEALANAEDARSIEMGSQALALYPGYVEPGSPYETVVMAAQNAGDGALALHTARTYFASGGRNPRVLDVLVESPDPAERLAVLEVLARTLPLEASRRTALAQALMDADRHTDAVTEFEAALSLEPHDLASAHYYLALAHSAAGDADAARSEVLLALEIAPRYAQALNLLLELHR